MTVKTESTPANTLTYSKMRGMVAILIGEWKGLALPCTGWHLLAICWIWILWAMYSAILCFVSCSFYETEKNGIERLYSEDLHQLLCLQAVSVFSSILALDRVPLQLG